MITTCSIIFFLDAASITDPDAFGKTVLTAVTPVNAFRLVTFYPVGYYDKDTIAQAGKDVGFSLQSVLGGQQFDCRFIGEVVNIGWGLTPGTVYFAGNNGFITATRPTTGFSQAVGIAKDADTLIINRQEATILA